MPQGSLGAGLHLYPQAPAPALDFKQKKPLSLFPPAEVATNPIAIHARYLTTFLAAVQVFDTVGVVAEVVTGAVAT